MTQKSKPTSFYATVSTSIVLVLISLFLLLYLHSGNITNLVKEQINILVELEDNLPQPEITSLQRKIAGFEGVKTESIEFISKTQALQEMSGEFSLAESGIENPFRDVLKFNVKSTYYKEGYINQVKSQLELEKGVAGIYHENENISSVKSNLDSFSFGILILAMCFVVLAMAIIYNTIRLTLYGDMKEIKTMKMVGASNSFIKGPYLRNAFVMAFKSMIAVVVFVALLCIYILQSNSVFSDIINWFYIVFAIATSFIIALILQMATTNATLNTFLKREGR
jgi:cell division transport system permease protein